MSTQYKVPEQLQKFLLLEDICDYDPKYDPYVFIARSMSKKLHPREFQGELTEYVGVRAFLIPTTQRDAVIGKFSYEEFSDAGRSYFANGNYVTGETLERDGVIFEIVANDRHFEGLDLSYYEPTDRMIVYLNLHRKDGTWINPYTKDVIIKTGDTNRGWGPHDAYISVRQSELIDYLATRKCGLLILRYSERLLYTPTELMGISEPFNKQTKHGRFSWIVEKSTSNQGMNMYFSRLWESFWIDQAPHPRRWDARRPEEVHGRVQFILKNGELGTYKGEDSYFEVLSFKPSLFKNFIMMPNTKIQFFCLSNLSLVYADASQIVGCINREGQFQSFFGETTKLDAEKQRQLAAFSEPQKAKPSYEYFRTNIEALFPETMPFNWTLSKCLEEINSHWHKKFGEALLLTPNENEIPVMAIIGPTSMDFEELTDIMMELQKLIIPESKVEKIKEKLSYESYATSADEYKEMRSIAFTRLFFRVNRYDHKDGESYILKAINEMRNCKGHPKDTIGIIEKFNMPKDSPRATFLFVMAELCNFLSAFKSLTESTLQVKGSAYAQKETDPFYQLSVANQYFLKPY